MKIKMSRDQIRQAIRNIATKQAIQYKEHLDPRNSVVWQPLQFMSNDFYENLSVNLKKQNQKLKQYKDLVQKKIDEVLNNDKIIESNARKIKFGVSQQRSVAKLIEYLTNVAMSYAGMPITVKSKDDIQARKLRAKGIDTQLQMQNLRKFIRKQLKDIIKKTTIQT